MFFISLINFFLFVIFFRILCLWLFVRPARLCLKEKKKKILWHLIYCHVYFVSCVLNFVVLAMQASQRERMLNDRWQTVVHYNENEIGCLLSLQRSLIPLLMHTCIHSLMISVEEGHICRHPISFLNYNAYLLHMRPSNDKLIKWRA